MTLARWQTFAPNFAEYFVNEYVNDWKSNWGFAHSIPGLTRSNGNCEGWNHWFKGKFTDNKRLPLEEFLPIFVDSLRYQSERQNPV